MKVKQVYKKDLIKMIVMVLFFMIYFIKSYGDAALAQGRGIGIIDDTKYLIIGLSILLCSVIIIKEGKIKKYLVNDCKSFAIWIISWIIISIIFSFNTSAERVFSNSYWIYIILPFMYTFGLIHILDEDNINTCFKVTLIISLFFYLFFEIGISNFTIDNVLRISYKNSYSPFESSYSSGVSVWMYIYFLFFKKDNKLWFLLSSIFCFLTFKRAAILVAIILFVLSAVLDINKKVESKVSVSIRIIFIIATISIKFLFVPENVYALNSSLNIDIDHLFMGRLGLYERLLNTEYRIAGLGTATDVLYTINGRGNGLELELLQILLELSIIGLAVFIFYVFKLTDNHLYLIFIVTYALFNMLTSSSLRNPFSWTLIYLIIWSIKGSYLFNNKKIAKNRKKFIRIIK